MKDKIMKKDSSHPENILILGGKILVMSGKIFISKGKSLGKILLLTGVGTIEVFREVLLPLIKKIPGAVKAGVRDIWAERINRRQLKTFYKPSDYLLAGL